MEIKLPGIYHIYNRGNNRQQIFYHRDNYFYFLEKCRRLLKPTCDILGWCLMPDHFDFLVNVTTDGLIPFKCGSAVMPIISNRVRLLLSSYAKGINRREGRTGSLFQQKTQSRVIDGNGDCLQSVLATIHQRPVKAGLVKNCGDWPYSSYHEYLQNNADNLCDIAKGNGIFNFDPITSSDTCVRRVL